MLLAFIIWSMCALLFLIIGISSKISKKPAGFFSNCKAPEVTDVKKYNNAVAKIWFVAAVIFELLGVPFLVLEQNSPIFILIMLPIPFLIILMVVVYLKIEAKYRKK